MGRRGCASAMGMIKFPSSCSSPKALCNQFIDYYICSRGVFCINHIKLRNFVVITIDCSIATVDRGSIMTRIYRWSMMVYSSLQAEFMVTKYDGHIHRYGALVFGKLVIYVSKSIDNIPAPLSAKRIYSDKLQRYICTGIFNQNIGYYTLASVCQYGSWLVEKKCSTISIQFIIFTPSHRGKIVLVTLFVPNSTCPRWWGLRAPCSTPQCGTTSSLTEIHLA